MTPAAFPLPAAGPAPRPPAASAGKPRASPPLPPRPAAPAAAVVGVAPVATLPIGAEVVAVSGCDPDCAPLACRINAVIARYWSAPRFSPDGGIALCMYSKRSRVVRARHVLRKFEPASCGASLRPARSGKWQLAQLVW